MIEVGSIYKFIKTKYPPPDPNEKPVHGLKSVDISEIVVSCMHLESLNDSGWSEEKEYKAGGPVSIPNYYEIKMNDIVLVCDIVEAGDFKQSILKEKPTIRINKKLVIFLLNEKYYEVGFDVFSYITERLA